MAEAVKKRTLKRLWKFNRLCHAINGVAMCAFGGSLVNEAEIDLAIIIKYSFQTNLYFIQFYNLM